MGISHCLEIFTLTTLCWKRVDL